MSVVNQMLRDLDQRQAPASTMDPLPIHIRPLPPATRSGLPWVLGAVVALAFAGSAAAWWYAQGAATEQVALPPAPADAQLPADPPPRLPPGPAAPEVQPTGLALPEPIPAQAVPGIEPVGEATQSARRPASPAAGRSATQSDFDPDGPDADRQAARHKTLALARPDSPPSAAAQPPRVEKRDRPSTPRERAERAHGLAAAALGRGDTAEAERSLREALREDAAYAAARHTLARLLAEQGRTGEARELLLEGLAITPDDSFLAAAVARMLAQSGELEDAMRVLAGVGESGAANAEFRGLRAAILQKLGRHAEAADDYRAALGISPEVGVWWIGLALCLEAQGQSAEAREAFQRAGLSAALTPELAAFVSQKLRGLP